MIKPKKKKMSPEWGQCDEGAGQPGLISSPQQGSPEPSKSPGHGRVMAHKQRKPKMRWEEFQCGPGQQDSPNQGSAGSRSQPRGMLLGY